MLITSKRTTRKTNKMTNEEQRVTLIKTFIRAYYQMELACGEGFKFEGRTYGALEDEISKLMTDEEFNIWVDCNEYQGEYWSKV